MIFRQLDENGDWQFGKGKNDIATQNRAIGLNIQTRLLSWFGDCFFDETAGIDYVNRLGSKNTQEILELDIKNTILQSQDVTGINSFSVSVTGRDFMVDYSVETIYSRSFTDRVQGTT